jgi:hypothetical protein
MVREQFDGHARDVTVFARATARAARGAPFDDATVA